MKNILSLPPATIWMMLEAYLLLGWARILKAVPFAKVAPSLGVHMEETPHTHRLSDEETIKQVSRVIRRVSRHTWWESMCLVKAIAAMKMLERRGIESTMYLGTSRDKAGKMVAHAWLRSGSLYVTGAEEMAAFTVVSKFGKEVPLKERHRRLENG